MSTATCHKGGPEEGNQDLEQTNSITTPKRKLKRRKRG